MSEEKCISCGETYEQHKDKNLDGVIPRMPCLGLRSGFMMSKACYNHAEHHWKYRLNSILFKNLIVAAEQNVVERMMHPKLQSELEAFIESQIAEKEREILLEISAKLIEECAPVGEINIDWKQRAQRCHSFIYGRLKGLNKK